MNTTINITQGIPSADFFAPAWASEPLTNVLKETDIPFALPLPDEDASLVAKDADGQVIGQCSANRAVKYWNHIDKTDCSLKNRSTQIFMKIHQLAVEEEKKHFRSMKGKVDTAYHSAGIAVLPSHRGYGLGRMMRKEQVELCKKLGASIIYCETTNKYSAATVSSEGFSALNKFPYHKLSIELEADELSKLDDTYTVWYLKI